MRRLALIMLAAGLLGLACDRYIDSRSPVISEPIELSAPINLSVALGDQAVTLKWDHAESNSVVRYRLYVSDSLDGEYDLRDSTAALTYRFENLVLNRAYFFAVAAIGLDGIEGRWSGAVSARVAPLSISIESGREYTNRRNVQIQLNSMGGTSHVILSEDSLFADAVYESFSASKSFELSSGEGAKTVYARFIFTDGAETADVLSDDITVDVRARIDSVFYTPAGPFVVRDTIRFGLDASEIGGEATVTIAGSSPAALFDDGVEADQEADDGIYSGWLIVPPEMAVTDAQITGSFTDMAGNSTSLVSAQVLSVLSTPKAVILTRVEALSSWEISLSWTEFSSQDFSEYRVYRDVSAQVSDSDHLVETISSRSQLSLVDTTVASATMYYYRVFAYNSSGLSSGSNTISAFTQANDPPDPVVLAGSPVDSTNIRLSWSSSHAEDFESYRIYRDQAPLADTSDGTLIEYIGTRSVTSFSDYAPQTGITYYYRIYVFDRQGAYTGSNQIGVVK